MQCQLFYAIPHLNQFTTDEIVNLNWSPQQDKTIGHIVFFIGYGQLWEPLPVKDR